MDRTKSNRRITTHHRQDGEANQFRSHCSPEQLFGLSERNMVNRIGPFKKPSSKTEMTDDSRSDCSHRRSFVMYQRSVPIRDGTDPCESFHVSLDGLVTILIIWFRKNAVGIIGVIRNNPGARQLASVLISSCLSDSMCYAVEILTSIVMHVHLRTVLWNP